MIRFIFFLIKVQWKDRIATSSFLIGITIQTILLSFVVIQKSLSPENALQLAIKGSLLTCIGISLFSAMSSIQNEFRYATVESILLSKVSFFYLIWIRSLFTGIVSLPAICIPFLAVIFAFPEAFNLRWLVCQISVYLTMVIIGFQSSFVLNVIQNPTVYVPWAKALILILGLKLVPFIGADSICKIFPLYWTLNMADFSINIIENIKNLILSAICGTLFVFLVCYKRVQNKIETNLTLGKII